MVISKKIFIFIFSCLLTTHLYAADSLKNSKVLKSINPQITDETLLICSFNIKIFSNESRNDEDLSYITDILKDYDVVAIQELRDKEIISRTISMLKEKGFSYGYDISKQVGKKIKERYAFLYRNDKVNLIKRGRLYQEKNDEFIREPFYATFKAGNFDFTIITILASPARRSEIIELERVYQKIQDEDPNEQDIILCGDFNFSPNDVGFDKLKSISTMTHLIKPPTKTTIYDKRSVDNFWFQEEYVREFTGGHGITYFDETIFNNDDKFAEIAVSDHRPIWAIFDIKKRDDD